MSLVAPAKPRATLQDTPAGLEIIIPARRNTFLTLFLGLWLCGWLAGEIATPAMLLRGPVPVIGLVFVTAWLAGWTLAGVFALYVFCWQLAGRERISVSPSRLAIRREVFGIGRVREYDTGHIQDLRVAPVSFNPFDFRSGLQFWGIGGGLIAFEYGATTIRFGSALEEVEAHSVVAEVRSRGRWA